MRQVPRRRQEGECGGRLSTIRRRAVWLLPCLMMLVGCGGPDQTVVFPGELLKEFEPPPITTGGDDFAIKIYIDGTVSMRGFVTPDAVRENALTVYQQVLSEGVEDAAQAQWPAVAPEFHQFGEISRKIDRSDWVTVATAPFYDEPILNQITNIQLVFEEARSTDLTVVATDLYQDDADIATVVRLLEERYFSADSPGTVGIIGIRSQYNGTIYDVGINNREFEYNTYGFDQCPAGGDAVAADEEAVEADDADADVVDPYPCLRPFYLIVAGQHADVEAYYRALAAILDGRLRSFNVGENSHDVRYEFVHVTPFVTADGIVSAREAREERKFVTENLQARGDIVSPPIENGPYLQYDRPEGGDVALAFSVPVQASDGVTLETVETPTVSKGGVEVPGVEVSAALADAAENLQTLSLELTVPGSQLADRATVFRLDVEVSTPYSRPAWVVDWNLAPSDVPLAETDSVLHEVGGRTLNLQRFVEQLMATLEDGTPAELARFHVYIRVR